MIRFIHILFLSVICLCTACIGNKEQTHNVPQSTTDSRSAWVDSVLGVTGIKIMDDRNEIYQYDDKRFYWNKKYDYFLAYPSNFLHGEEAELCDGNSFINKDSTICLHVFAAYFDVFKDDYTLLEWFDSMIDSEIEQGNCIWRKDFTDNTYVIQGNTKEGRCLYQKAVCKMAYEREIIVTVELEYTESVKAQAENLINTNISNFPYNPL